MNAMAGMASKDEDEISIERQDENSIASAEAPSLVIA
jgi:hypothetical protein